MSRKTTNMSSDTANADDIKVTSPDVDAATEQKKEAQPSNTTAARKSVKTQDPAILDQFKKMLERYAQVATSPRIYPAQRIAIIKQFAQIVRFATSHPSTAILDTFYDFLLDKANAILSPKLVMQEADTLELAERDRVTGFYTVFVQLMTTKKFGHKFTLSPDAIRAVIKSPQVVDYVMNKLNEK